MIWLLLAIVFFSFMFGPIVGVLVACVMILLVLAGMAARRYED